MWYLCGLQEISEGHSDQAWKSWRRSLELSNRYLPEILATSRKQLQPGQILDQVLPQDPDILLLAAGQLFPEGQAVAGRQLFFEKMLFLLDQPSSSFSEADRFHIKGLIHASLVQPEKAEADYQAALARKPEQTEWRFELARLLYLESRLEESHHELVIVLAQQPENAQARDLLNAVRREMAKRS